MPVRRPAARPDPPGADAAARRLALIAADLGVARSTPSPEAADEPAEETAEPWWADHTRVAAPAPPDPAHPVDPAVPVREVEVGEVPALPLPGRHAARRRGRRPRPRAVVPSVADRLPALGMPQVAVVAIAVALGLAVTTWWVLRDRPGPLAPVSAAPADPLVTTLPPEPGSSAAPTPPTGSAAAASAPATVTVDVAGKVRRPGIVVLDAGARVTDAVEAAGGARKGVDLTPLNLARVLVDGEQVVVGAPAATVPSGSPGAGGGGPAGPLVNLNTAGLAELESLPQVGPVTAQAIIAWREARGGFTSVDELLEVDGIGDKTLAQITPHVTV
ncbi:helix-hairpin-helix domain-containing protein [Nocardioides carbamazepini]|uniref:helix-hairpin-helix domain-containing protein n=1 Tax=Nocardioides carbamazepini TaxID=2854259 RepID=UPI00214A0A2F|nr:helix-hairpin-helix domain-containing protein [Nocardioides carbamazepini]MCR1782333.1 helix-hairpin-helix domain-containing protein [Nocardioides carbamazepini]